MTTAGYIGIDAGTQGLSVVFTDETMNVLATGTSDYEMVPDLSEGCYEQQPEDWEKALRSAMQAMRSALPNNIDTIDVLAIGISGQMHGEVLADEKGRSLGPVRLWCDARNDDEGNELTSRLGAKMPKRITVARWLWTIRNQPDRAQATAHITTPGGWLAYQLTGEWNLGIGDAAGMFPIDQSTLDYDQSMIEAFDQLVGDKPVRPLAELLPTVRRAGQSGGTLNEAGAQLLGLPIGTLVAPAEGDQPCSLAGSLIGDAGMVSVSFGTSVCANSVGDRPFEGVSPAVDHFCAPDGKPINMVWLRNGTTFMNTLVEMFGQAAGMDRSEAFEKMMAEAIQAEPDCGGLLALPFMDDEPGLGIQRGGTATVTGLNPDNATAGNKVKASLLATMFNLRRGSEVLDQQGFSRNELILAGGLTQTPETGQILADVFNTDVRLLDSAAEGSAWGAAMLGRFRHLTEQGGAGDWSEFLASHASENDTRFSPNADAVIQYAQVYDRYTRLLEVHVQWEQALNSDTA